MSVLLIEDDEPLASGLAQSLRQAGYRVDLAGNVHDACTALDRQVYGLVVLDLGLPDLDGGEVVKHMSTRRIDTPVLVLSDRDEIEERVRLLDLGADDFLVKPVAMEEFLARVRAVSRRRRGGPRLVLGRLDLDLDGMRAYLDGQPFDLNSREWMLLAFLAARPNRAVTKEDIAAALYGAGEGASVNALDQIMSRFRRRIAGSGLNLRTVRGLGYYLEVDDGGAT